MYHKEEIVYILSQYAVLFVHAMRKQGHIFSKEIGGYNFTANSEERHSEVKNA